MEKLLRLYCILTSIIFLLPDVFCEHRSKRFLFINPDAPITLGFILNMPISLALPSLVFSGRSFNGMNEIDSSEYPSDLEEDPNYAETLGTLKAYFAYLQIHTLPCQERFICDITANSDNYSPVSELFMKQLSRRYGPLSKSKRSLMWRYMAATREGFLATADECKISFNECAYPAHKLINMSVIKVWQYIAEILKMQLV